MLVRRAVHRRSVVDCQVELPAGYQCRCARLPPIQQPLLPSLCSCWWLGPAPQTPSPTFAGPTERSGCGVRQFVHSALLAALVRRQVGQAHPGSDAAAGWAAVAVERLMEGTRRCGSGTCEQQTPEHLPY